MTYIYDPEDEEIHDDGYCRHGHDPADCEELCVCEHQCNEHIEHACTVLDCECDGFEDM